MPLSVSFIFIFFCSLVFPFFLRLPNKTCLLDHLDDATVDTYLTRGGGAGTA